MPDSCHVRLLPCQPGPCAFYILVVYISSYVPLPLRLASSPLLHSSSTCRRSTLPSSPLLPLSQSERTCAHRPSPPSPPSPLAHRLPSPRFIPLLSPLLHSVPRALYYPCLPPVFTLLLSLSLTFRCRRGWWDETLPVGENNVARLAAFCAIPVIGPAAYLLVRPSLEE